MSKNRSALKYMKAYIFVFLTLFLSTSWAGLYSDSKKEWKIVGSEVIAVCVTDFITGSTKSYGPMKIVKASSQIIDIELEDKDGKQYKIKSDLCYLEQTTKESVARIEFLEAIYSLECNYSMLSFKNVDFRIMGENTNFITAKKLSDGSVFVFSKKLCTVKETAPRIDRLSRPSLESKKDKLIPVGVSG